MTIECGGCGLRFEPYRPQHRFCSKSCQSKIMGTEYGRRWKAKNPDKVREGQARRQPQATERSTATRRLRLYGVTPEQYHALWLSQSGECAMCGDKSASLALDHNHSTGEVRGLLCSNCNRGLGQVEKFWTLAKVYLRGEGQFLP